MKTLLRLALGLLSRPVFSRFYGRLCRRRHPKWLVRRVIDGFQKHYRIDMNEYAGEASDYPSLLDFFVRPLDPAKRPLVGNPAAIVSPADGFLQTMETLSGDQAMQAKGMSYTVSELLCEPLDFSQPWRLAVVYLSPRNYHRFHYPATATLESYCHAGGPLYPVNTLGTSLIPRLFARNERVVAKFTLDGQPLYVVAVGATFVGSIRLEFAEKPWRDTVWRPARRPVEQLAEMGRFELGSTLILVCPAALATPNAALLGQPVRVGDPVFLRPSGRPVSSPRPPTAI
ncbi:MAG TPA: archaetidylserine decarboxylase [Candidatus Aminicenantes bacterium]|nr:archaetidylserine decarboxylase [Candidatus Aminicenantes bacterium]